jgi:multidrug resistance efflux pump
MTALDTFAAGLAPGSFALYPNASLNTPYDGSSRVFEPSAVAKADAQVKLTRYQVSQCVVRAPYDGFVVRLMGKPFQTATVGQPLLEMISAGVPKLRVSASSKLFTRIRVGTPLRVTIDETGLTYMAAVSSINARIDPVNQTFEMEARLQRGGTGLLPGMSGTAVIAGAASPKPRER